MRQRQPRDPYSGLSTSSVTVQSGGVPMSDYLGGGVLIVGIIALFLTVSWLIGAAFLFIVEVVLHQPKHDWWLVLLIGMAVSFLIAVFRSKD